jgi:hypothetical protein
MSRTTKDEQAEQHKHLCGLCNAEFICDGEDCSEFVFGACPTCEEKSKRRRRLTSTAKKEK